MTVIIVERKCLKIQSWEIGEEIKVVIKNVPATLLNETV